MGECSKMPLSRRTALIGLGDEVLAGAVADALGKAGVRVVRWEYPSADPAVADTRFLVDPLKPNALAASFAGLHRLGVDIFVSLPQAEQAMPFAAYQLRAWALALTGGVTAPFLVSRELLPAMVKRGFGRIVHVVSAAAEGNDPERAGTAAAEAGLVALTRVVARSCLGRGVTVNALIVADGIEAPCIAQAVRETCCDGRRTGRVDRLVRHPPALS
jgi:NAD(P)-dependent dehydrogenase (short-subunit alcohol dehydrogenase family)